jgi:hypothetical protein
VAAENYLQHAEHYFRLIAAAQAAQTQAQSGRPPGEGEGGEFEDDDDFGGVADRFASPAERTPAPYTPPPAQGQGYVAPPQPGVAGAGPQPYSEGGERPPQPQSQPQGERNGGYQGQGRQQDRQQRPQQDRGSQQDRNFADRQNRDGRGRDFRPREFRPYRDANAPRDAQPAPVVDAATALPSFITAAPRVTVAPDAETPAPMENGVEAGGQVDQGSSAFEQSGDGRSAGRGRRRRLRSPYGFHPSGNQEEEGEGPQAPDDAPVSE